MKVVRVGGLVVRVKMKVVRVGGLVRVMKVVWGVREVRGMLDGWWSM